MKSTLIFRDTCYLSLIYNGFYKQKLSRGVASGAQACFLTVKSTATPPGMLTRPEICLQILLYYFIKVLMFEDLS